MRLVGVTRVWNERAIIREVVERNRSQLDDYIIIDKGSDDGTWEILQELNLPYLFRINLTEDREAEDRKIAYRMAWMLKPDWVFQIDSDEIIHPFTHPLRELLKRVPKDVDAVYTQLVDFLWNPAHPEPFIYDGKPSVFENRNYICKGHRWTCRLCRPKEYIDFGASVTYAKNPLFLYDVILRHYTRCLNPEDTAAKIARWQLIREAREKDGLDTSYVDTQASLDYFNWEPTVLHPFQKLENDRYFVKAWNEEFVRPRARWLSDVTKEAISIEGPHEKIHDTLTHYLQTEQYLITTPLCELLRHYGSDKGNALHNYGSLYYLLFNNVKQSTAAVFELGIGSTNPDIPCSMGLNGTPGGSLRALKEFFYDAHIVGADIDRDTLFCEERIQTYYCDQEDSASIQALWKQIDIPLFDIMIDDGLHKFSANKGFFLHSIDRLKKGGIYIIEDIDRKEFEPARTFMEQYRHRVQDIILLEIPHKRDKPDNNLLIIIK